ncbi:MAG: phage tail protein [Chloroflexota bacterium]
MNETTPYLYVNLADSWPEFVLDGLEVVNGRLQLPLLPGNATPIGPLLDPVEALSGPAGLGMDELGNLYLADPANHLVWRVDGCDGSAKPLPCLRGPGQEPGQLNGPRGLVVGPNHALYVADSGNHRVQVIDLHTQQVRAVWGQPDPYLLPPQPGTENGRFDQPWDLAVDADEYLYVVDSGNRRVQKFDAAGRVYAAFWAAMSSQDVVPQEPTFITTAVLDGEERLLILDAADNRALLYHTDGRYDLSATERWADVANHVTQPVGAIVDPEWLFVADAANGRLIVFRHDGTFVGIVPSSGSLAGLALDCQGRLLLHPGGGGQVQQLETAVAFGDCGVFLAGPYTGLGTPPVWHRIQAELAALPDNGHIQFFTYTSETADSSSPPALPISCATTSALLTDAWLPAPVDGADFLVLNQPGRYLWLAGRLQGDGSATPALAQMRISYNHESWARHLPAIYTQDPMRRAFLDQSLSLFESLLADVEALVDDLPQLFDPWAASNENAPDSWLDWLAGWLAFALDEQWTEEQRRQALAEAFAAYGRRGTVESLRELIRLYAGATAHISEPARFASLWSLGETSTLGFDTMLAAAYAQGAVVGNSATLDQSHLITEEAYGAPLFDELAHRFCVQIYASDLAVAGTEDRVHDIVDREKPAHTSYHLCLIEANMRVGFQARLGIDTIVSGGAPDLVLTEPQALGMHTALPAAPEAEQRRRRLGHDARVGAQDLTMT